jgi:N-acetylglutamate synthase-like GNAT family acetyltransferase
MVEVIRRAKAADAVAIRALTRAVYAKWMSVIGREPFPMTADYDVAVVQHWIDVLDRDGALVALVEMIPHIDHLFIANLAVAEAMQGKGLGVRMLRHAEDVARNAALAEVQLATNQAFASNVAFYERQGYVVCERSLMFDGGTALRFRKSIT